MESNSRKSWSNRLILASLFFGMLFGAGNLIFPISIGQYSGSNMPLASLGFVISGVGIACLAVVLCAQSKSKSLESLLIPYGKHYARAFTVVLLLTIGPFFALPRTATVPYEVGIRALFPTINHTNGLLVYSTLFFALALFFSLKPNLIQTLIGKIINPLFLLCLSFFILTVLIRPLGPVSTVIPNDAYAISPITQGFSMGYQTMDVLAALAFSFILVNASNKDSNNNETTLDVIYAAVFAGALMIILYFVLAYIGATSRNIMPLQENGGVTLGLIFNHYYGTMGTLFLALTITFACLKTAVGLIVACSTYFTSIIPQINYRHFCFIFTILAMIISNFGLTRIIEYAVPVLNFLYPLAILHVISGLVFKFKYPNIDRWLLYSTFIAASIEFLTTLPAFQHILWIESLKNIYVSLPLGSIGLSWINFSFVGLLIGVSLQMNIRIRKENP